MSMRGKTFPVIIKRNQRFFKRKYDLTIPKIMLQGLKKKPTKAKISMHEIEVTCALNNSDHIITMSDELLQKLHVFDGLECQAYIENDCIRFGPVIGAFVARSYINKLKNQNARERTMELYKANRQAKTILYFFCIQGVDFKNNLVEGYFYDWSTKLWRRHIFPFPDVLYDRGSGKPNKRLPRQKFRQKLATETSCKNFNAQHYFDKYDLYHKLSQFKELREHLPKTVLYTHPNKLTLFNNKNEIYIKNCIGSNGRHIMKVKKHPQKGYVCSLFTKQVIKQKVDSLKELVKIIDRKYTRNNALIQEAIDLPSPNGRNIDMRATVQRDGKGELVVTSIAVRVGERGSPVTSTRTGSTCYRFEDFFERTFSSQKQVKQLREKIDKFLIMVYTCTEKSYGPFGEIGIDFALDQQGKLWLIECNAKPAKDAMCQSYDQETISKAFLYPLEYSKYIAGFNT